MTFISRQSCTVALMCAGWLSGVNAAIAGDSIAQRLSIHGLVEYRVLNEIKLSENMQAGRLWGDERQLSRRFDNRISGEACVNIAPSPAFFFTIGYRTALATVTGYRTQTGTGYESSSGLSQCQATYRGKFGSLTGGKFRYTYNPDSRNLGEYLLLSGSYPGYVYSGLEMASQTGLLLHTDIPGGFSNDILFTSEMLNLPLYDFSLSYIGSYTIARALTVGAGISFNRLISVRPEATTPDPVKIDSQSIALTHRGVKGMVRMSLDIKALCRCPVSLLGPQDLRLYAEAAWLGLRNYPVYFENPRERVPLMIGLNLPAFKLLDYLAVEAEWYGSPHVNTPPNATWSVMPSWVDIGSRDDFKWSVSARRALNRNLALYARAASDHFRFEMANGATEYLEHFSAPDQWYWSMTLQARF